MVIVPYILGLSREEAQARLAEAGLDATFTARESDEPKNTVIGARPNIADSVPAGSTVTVFLSTGPVEVPNVVGLTEQQATARLVAAGLRYVIERDPTTPAENGRVLAQDPNGLTEVPRGSTVTITISSYEEPTPTPTETPTVEPTTPVPTDEPPISSPTVEPPPEPDDDDPGRGRGRGRGGDEPEE
jgi:serine/threonine-protein kinase